MMTNGEKMIWAAAFVRAVGTGGDVVECVKLASATLAMARMAAIFEHIQDRFGEKASAPCLIELRETLAPDGELLAQFEAVPRWGEEDNGDSGDVSMEPKDAGDFLKREDVLALVRKLVGA